MTMRRYGEEGAAGAVVVATAAVVVVARAIVRLESGTLIPPEISGNIGSVWVCLSKFVYEGKGGSGGGGGEGAPAGAATC